LLNIGADQDFRLEMSVRKVADSDISFWAPVECRALRKICRIDV